eukprot:1699123-Prymnesium_polylepis.4
MRRYATRRSSPEYAPRIDQNSRKVTGDARRGSAVTLQRVICANRIWTEFGPNFVAGDRGRSNEIEGGRSNLTQLRRSSLN